ncbi:hypothetical protein HRbin17_00498 [bacterium HR17]|uniref:Uncharacterized protein n=1 Tax=Candidatus Fervidibacter japonicus TaxID=2035412 RepID=A0A2H5X9Y8_9BACT|nr:hypothetical protein HRbin17_00498 [bacterium HR17]
MSAISLAHCLWDALQRGEATPCANAENALIRIAARAHDEFSCAAEQVTVQWQPSTDWQETLRRCENALQILHRAVALVENDETEKRALFRSPISRDAYWEGQLRADETSTTLTVQRLRLGDRGQRQPTQFLVTVEQVADFLAALLD